MLLDNSLSAQILLVSDDAQLRSLLGGLLVAHGYDGVLGVDSQSALSTERLRAKWDVAIVVIGPKKNGAGTPHEVAVGGDVVLGKPFDPRELLLIVRGMLERDDAAGAPSDAPVSVGPISLAPLLNAALRSSSPTSAGAARTASTTSRTRSRS